MATIRDVKKALAAAFPAIEFTYGPGGRGRERGHAVRWVGGPSVEDVRAVVWPAECSMSARRWDHIVKHYQRGPTPEEYAALEAQWEAERAAREAARPAERAAAKAAGIEKRAGTAARRKALMARAGAAFPGVAFKIEPLRYQEGLAWSDGPTTQEVAEATGTNHYSHTRHETPEGRAARVAMTEAAKHANRLARRLAASKARPIAQAAKAARRAKAAERRAARLAVPLFEYFSMAA